MFQVKWFEKFKMHTEEFEDYKAAETRYYEVRKQPGVQCSYVFKGKDLVLFYDEDWYPGIDGREDSEPDEWPLRSMITHDPDDPGVAFQIRWLDMDKGKAYDGDGWLSPKRWVNTYGHIPHWGGIEWNTLSYVLDLFNRLYELGVLLEVTRRQVHSARFFNESLDLPALGESLNMAVEELEMLLNMANFDDSGRWKNQDEINSRS